MSVSCVSHFRKSANEHKSQLENMDKEKREMEKAIANSLVDQKRLEAEREKQRMELVAHFKSKMGSKPAEIDQSNNKGMSYRYHLSFYLQTGSDIVNILKTVQELFEFSITIILTTILSTFPILIAFFLLQ